MLPPRPRAPVPMGMLRLQPLRQPPLPDCHPTTSDRRQLLCLTISARPAPCPRRRPVAPSPLDQSAPLRPQGAGPRRAPLPSARSDLRRLRPRQPDPRPKQLRGVSDRSGCVFLPWPGLHHSAVAIHRGDLAGSERQYPLPNDRRRRTSRRLPPLEQQCQPVRRLHLNRPAIVHPQASTMRPTPLTMVPADRNVWYSHSLASMHRAPVTPTPEVPEACAPLSRRQLGLRHSTPLDPRFPRPP